MIKRLLATLGLVGILGCSENVQQLPKPPLIDGIDIPTIEPLLF
ncbi:MAG: hypothetical protein WC595_03770 [Candidatus Nanoarchaeia archaeon]